MFEASFLLLTKALLLNILLPIIPGTLFLWLFFGNKFKGLLLYILGRFIGVGVVAFSLFNIQFLWFGVGIKEYFIILGIVIIALIIKITVKKIRVKSYFELLKIKINFQELKTSFLELPKIQKYFFIIGSFFVVGFTIFTFLQNTNFPTYGDDSFGNRNGPALNIYHDGGIKIFGEKEEILGRGRLGYPIMIPVYKAMISNFMGGFNDIYINLRQWLLFFGLLLFVIKVTYDKTKNIFYSLLPAILICGLPLTFFHSMDGYMELACATYSVFTIWAFWKFLEKNEYEYISLGLLFGFVLSHIKNDGLLGYFAGICFAFFIIILLSKKIKIFFKGFIEKKSEIFSSLFFFSFFLIPFLIIRFVNKLGFNPVSTNDGSLGVSTIHREIFSQFKQIFIQMDNYNVAIIIIAMITIYFIQKRKKIGFNYLFLLFSFLAVFLMFLLVFLLTENYKRVMDQTTVNRVFTMSFIILFSFIGIIINKQNE